MTDTPTPSSEVKPAEATSSTPPYQTLKIEVVNNQAQTPTEQTAEPEHRKDNGLEYKFNTEYHRFCNDLGVDKYKRDDVHVAEKIAMLYDWGKEQAESEDGEKISLAIRDLVRTLGIQGLQGESLVNSLYRWTRLDMAGEKLRMKEKESEFVQKELSIKKQITAIEPKISNEELERRVKAGMKDVNKKIKYKVKSYVTSAINKGIREAIERSASVHR